MVLKFCYFFFIAIKDRSHHIPIPRIHSYRHNRVPCFFRQGDLRGPVSLNPKMASTSRDSIGSEKFFWQNSLFRFFFIWRIQKGHYCKIYRHCGISSCQYIYWNFLPQWNNAQPTSNMGRNKASKNTTKSILEFIPFYKSLSNHNVV